MIEKRRRQHWFIRLRFLLMLLSVLAISLDCLIVAFKRYSARRQEANFARYEDILRDIQGGVLRPNNGGVIVLPPRFAATTANAKAYLTYAPDKSHYYVLFPIDVDGGEAAGFLYSSSSFSPEQAGDEWIEFPSLSAVHPTRQEIASWFVMGIRSQYLAAVDSRRHPHWYFAEPFYD